jgi:hypothetical protein
MGIREEKLNMPPLSEQELNRQLSSGHDTNTLSKEDVKWSQVDKGIIFPLGIVLKRQLTIIDKI